LLRDIWFNHFHVLPERSPPIEEVIQAGVVPRFIEFLMREDFPQLQVIISLVLFYAIYIYFLNIGLTSFTVKLLASPSDDVCEQVCIYTLYHIVLLFLSINKVYMFSSFLLGVALLFVLIKLSGNYFA
jgi:hypothetical protein